MYTAIDRSPALRLRNPGYAHRPTRRDGEMANAADLKSAISKEVCGFDPRSRHPSVLQLPFDAAVGHQPHQGHEDVDAARDPAVDEGGPDRQRVEDRRGLPLGVAADGGGELR